VIVCDTIEETSESDRCLFCAAALTGDRAREHVFARWLTSHYSHPSKPFNIDWFADGSGDLRDRRNLTMSRLVAGRVCRTCNNGWMSALESQVSKLLIDLASLTRSLSTLEVSERKLLARWTTKTAFAARSIDLAPKVVKPEQHRALVNGGMPSVWVLARQAEIDLGLNFFTTQRWLISYPQEARDETAHLVGRSHKTVLTVGHLILAVCHWPDSRWRFAISRLSHSPLWPATGTWLTYGHATNSHGVPPTPGTEIVDMVIGTRVAHPTRGKAFAAVDVLDY
jgi:hypothetical protein